MTDKAQAQPAPIDGQSSLGDVPERLLRYVEALLMAADEPLSLEQFIRLLETVEAIDKPQLRCALNALRDQYADTAVDLVEVAGGWRFQVGADYAGLVSRLWEERTPKLSRAMLETLAIICYRQPLARSDIEAVRGVSVSSNIVKTLEEFGWIKIVGYREVPGRPALFATTPQFLDDFAVRRLSDLPALPEIKDLDALDAAVARLQQTASDTGEEEQGEDRSMAETPRQAPDSSAAVGEKDNTDSDRER